MVEVKMLETRQGSPDGIQTPTYEAGKTYELPEELARVFLREGWAEKPLLAGALLPADGKEREVYLEANTDLQSNPGELIPSETELPEDFPGAAELRAADYTTREQVAALSDEELLKVPGVGPATVTKIREALSDPQVSDGDS